MVYLVWGVCMWFCVISFVVSCLLAVACLTVFNSVAPGMVCCVCIAVWVVGLWLLIVGSFGGLVGLVGICCALITWCLVMRLLVCLGGFDVVCLVL